MPKINLSHFEAAFLFSVFVSVVMGITSKKTQNERLHYGLLLRLLPCWRCSGSAGLMKLGHG